MSQISGVNNVSSALPVQRREGSVEQASERLGGRPGEDRVEISNLGALLSQARDLPDVRVERIARIRAEIAAGTFETPERIEGTVGRLLEEL